MHPQSSQNSGSPERIAWGTVPFFAAHAVALIGPFFVPWHWGYVLLAVGLYYLRMFGITAGFHRYFAHRAFKTDRFTQFLLALIGTMASQKGVLWWAAHHRDHHKYSDQEQDLHSPLQRGFWWSHLGWILCDRYNETKYERIRDFTKYPELMWLNRHWWAPPVGLALLLFAVGGTGALVWGFFVSTVALWHGTFAINSLAHVFGSRRYETTDGSRNSLILALLTLGEGWHNNHHHYQSSANQGFFWWEIDISFYVLRVMSWCRLVSDLRKPPQRLLVRVQERLRDGLATAEEVLARAPSREELTAKLAAARLALELFPERVRERVAQIDLSAHLSDELLERLAEVGAALERLPEDLRSRLKDAERALERLPEELRAKLPSAEELLDRLCIRDPLPA